MTPSPVPARPAALRPKCEEPATALPDDAGIDKEVVMNEAEPTSVICGVRPCDDRDEQEGTR
jgi:hypothetical protein